MADRIPALAIAFLVLVLMPQLVSPAKLPRFKMSPRTKKQLRNFFKDHSSDMADLFPSQQQGDGSYNGQSQPGDGSYNGQSEAPATSAGMYVFSLEVGTPPQSVSGVLDISSELVWAQCAPCATCDATLATPFYPALSATVAKVPCTSRACQQFVPQTCSAGRSYCSYDYTYGGGRANTTGLLAADTFTFGETRADVVFGRGVSTVGDFGGASGVISLGRGSLSLVSQLQLGRFSYYFAPDGSVDTASFILFGDDAIPQTSRPLSTPLLASRAYPNLYFVGLAGIQVDGKDLAIQRGTFDLQADGSGGVFLSISVPITFLEEVAYKLLRQALVSSIGLRTVDGSALGLDLCYTSQSLAKAKVLDMALVFAGNAIMELQTGNFFYKDASTGLECLTILPSSAGGRTLLGSLIQTGTHMMYDIQGSRLVFESFEQASTRPSKSFEQVSRPSSAAATSRICPVVIVHFLWVVVVYKFL